MSTIFPIGSTAWWAHCGQREVTRSCPVCFGKLRVTVILGNEEAISTPCDYCGKGYEGPTGTEKEYEWVASPELFFINSVRTESDGGKTSASYMDARGYSVDDVDLFATRAEAEARCAVRIAENAEEERQRREWRKEQAHKSFSWHVGYHRREAKKLSEKIKWHEARAIACAERAKTPIAETEKQ